MGKILSETISGAELTAMTFIACKEVILKRYELSLFRFSINLGKSLEKTQSV